MKTELKTGLEFKLKRWGPGGLYFKLVSQSSYFAVYPSMVALPQPCMNDIKRVYLLGLSLLEVSHLYFLVNFGFIRQHSEVTGKVGSTTATTNFFHICSSVNPPYHKWYGSRPMKELDNHQFKHLNTKWMPQTGVWAAYSCYRLDTKPQKVWS